MHPHLAIQVASAPSPSTHVSESCLAALGKTVGKAAHPTKVATGLQPCSTRRICAGFFSVLAVVAITLNFFRICYGLRGQGNLSRRLAGREPPEKEDPVLSAILDMCLDMEEEVSGCPQTLAVRPERGWETHPPWQPLLPYQAGQQGSPVGVFAPPPEWGAFQQHSVEQFLQRPELLGPQGNYGMVGPLGAEAAHTLPLEGPSTSWQGAFMLPPHGDSPPTTANEGSISPAFPWSRITPLPFQGLRPVSSFGVAGAQAGPGVPAAMAMPNPALSGGVPTNENQHIWGNAGHHHPVPAKEDGKLKRRFDDAGLLRAQSPEISHAMKREKLLPNEGKLRVSASRAHAEHSNASSSKTQRSAAVAKELAGSRGQQGSASSSSVQAAGNLGRDADADSPSTQPGAKAEGVPSRHPFYRLPKLQDGADLNVAKFSAEKAFSLKTNINIPGIVLRNLHNCFAKQYLSEYEANDIIRSSQRLVGHLYNCHQTTVKVLTPAEAVVALGRRYIMLEFLVCAIQVLGPAMDAQAWWKKLVNAIPGQISFPPMVHPSKRCSEYKALAERLGAAIESLKQGIRPGAEETVELKRDLFCRANSHPEFKTSRWQLWRRDDKNPEAFGWR